MPKFNTVAQGHKDFLEGFFKETLLTPVEREAIKAAYYSGFISGATETITRMNAKDANAMSAMTLELREYFDLAARGLN